MFTARQGDTALMIPVCGCVAGRMASPPPLALADASRDGGREILARLPVWVAARSLRLCHRLATSEAMVEVLGLIDLCKRRRLWRALKDWGSEEGPRASIIRHPLVLAHSRRPSSSATDRHAGERDGGRTCHPEKPGCGSANVFGLLSGGLSGFSAAAP